MTQTDQLKKQFRSAIRRGTGEAYLLMQEHTSVDFSDDIIKACVKNYAYDGQCEQSRAPYLFELICLSAEREKIRSAILNALATEQNDTWTLVQLFELAKLFAEGGDEEARKGIYARFFTDIINGYDWAGYQEILELDGMKGLLLAAEKIGRALEENPDDWHDHQIIARFQAMHPEINVMHLLEEAAKENRYVGLYLEKIKQSEEQAKNYVKPDRSYTDVVEAVLTNKINSFFVRKQLTAQEINQVAQRLLIEKNRSNQEKLLATFIWHKFPLDSEFILNLAKNKSRSAKKIKELAVRALKWLTSDAIRAFALREMVNSKHPGDLAAILTSNYKTGDNVLLTALLKKHNKEHVLESLVLSCRAIYEANPGPDCLRPIEAIYDQSTCGICRKHLVQMMMENGVLSEKIKNEIAFDCNDGTRELLTGDGLDD